MYGSTNHKGKWFSIDLPPLEKKYYLTPWCAIWLYKMEVENSRNFDIQMPMLLFCDCNTGCFVVKYKVQWDSWKIPERYNACRCTARNGECSPGWGQSIWWNLWSRIDWKRFIESWWNTQGETGKLEEPEERRPSNKSSRFCFNGGSWLVPPTDGALLASWRRVSLYMRLAANFDGRR